MMHVKLILYSSLLNTQFTPKGSLGARINELKQRVIAENPHRYAVAVPREWLVPTFFNYQWTLLAPVW